MADEALDEAIRAADLDELLRLVDRMCAARDWDGLESLRERCARAHESGRQLWPAASHAAYRLALEAPAAHVATVLVDDGAPFSLGPLPEVAAQSHSWADLAPHLRPGAAAVLFAHERVVRGEDLRDVDPPGPPVLEIPLHLEPWEPSYAVGEYASDRAEFPMPAIPELRPVSLPDRPSESERDEASTALVELTRAWVDGSNGRAEAVTVAGDGLAAIAALDVTDARTASLEPATAVALMAWAAASGGAHGRRPGAAAGRFGAWWAAGALTGLLDEWPPPAELLGDRLIRLGFLVWSGGTSDSGWRLQLAIEDAAAGRAWAVVAVDAE